MYYFSLPIFYQVASIKHYTTKIEIYLHICDGRNSYRGDLQYWEEILVKCISVIKCVGNSREDDANCVHQNG